MNEKKSADEILQDAMAAHQKGDISHAASNYEKILATEKKHADALHLLSLIELQRGDLKKAITLVKQAIEVANKPSYLSSLSQMLLVSKDYKAAKKVALDAISHEQDSASARNILGSMALKNGDIYLAVYNFSKAIELNPNLKNAKFNKASCYFKLNKFSEAISLYQEILPSYIGSPEIWNNLGNAFLETNNIDSAISSYEKAIETDKNFTAAKINLAKALRKAGEPNSAKEYLQEIVDQKCQDIKIFNELGVVLKDLALYEKSIKILKDAIAIDENNADAYATLGALYYDRKNLKAAKEHLKKALEINPQHCSAFYNMGQCLKAQGYDEQALEAFIQAAKFDNNNMLAFGSIAEILLMQGKWDSFNKISEKIISQYSNKFTRDRITHPIHPFISLFIAGDNKWQSQVASDWSNRIQTKSKSKKYEYVALKNPETIKIGYISADFCNTSLGSIIRDTFVYHNTKNFDIFCYATRLKKDHIMQQVKNCCEKLHDFSNIAADKAADIIYNDKIDILVDLSGFSNFGRPEILALRPAPNQCLMLGYPYTAGGTIYDYFLTTKDAVPETAAINFNEKIIYLPDTPFATHGFTLPSGYLSRKTLHLPDDSFIYAALHKPQYINKKTFDCWMEILRQVPNAKLWMQSNDDEYKEMIYKNAKAAKIESNRIIITPVHPLNESWHQQLADVALDSVFFSASNHTVFSIWAGLPVVTMVDETPQSRVSASYLKAAGLPEMVTTSYKDYISMAVSLATDKENLHSIRGRLLKTREVWPLFTPLRFVGALEKVYRDIFDGIVKKK